AAFDMASADRFNPHVERRRGRSRPIFPPVEECRTAGFDAGTILGLLREGFEGCPRTSPTRTATAAGRGRRGRSGLPGTGQPGPTGADSVRDGAVSPPLDGTGRELEGRQIMARIRLAGCVLAAGMVVAAPALAEDLTIASWGGTYQD